MFILLMDANDVKLDEIPDDAFVVYRGDQQCFSCQCNSPRICCAHVILPAPAFSEKGGYIHLTQKGVVQTKLLFLQVLRLLMHSRDDWKNN